MHSLFVLEDKVLLSLSRDPKFANAFPFLKSISASKSGRRCCGRSSIKMTLHKQLNAVKQTIAGMSRGAKTRLRKLLDTKQARVRYIDGSGKTHELTF